MRRDVLILTFVMLVPPVMTARGQIDTPPAVKVLLARSKANFGRDAATQTLQGVKQVMVEVEPLDPTAASIGLDTAHIRTLVETRLRDHGLAVAAQVFLGRVDPTTGTVKDFHLPPGGTTGSPPMVDVQLTVVALPTGPTAVAVNIWVKQAVTLVRDPANLSYAHTWSTGTLFVGTDAKAAQEASDGLIAGQIDRLLSATQAANRQ